MNIRFVLGVAVMLAVGCGGSGGPAPSPAPDGGAVDVKPALADLIEIDQIDVLQGTTVTLLADATSVTKRIAPIIAGRPGLVRVHARTLDRRTRVPALVAELRIHATGKDDVVITDGPRSLQELDPSDLQTTFDFDLATDAITTDARIEVSLRDPKAADDLLWFPADPPGLALGAVSAGTALRVKFVPIQYNADASGRLPTLDDRTVEDYRRSLYKMYPTSEVHVSVREPIPFGVAITGKGDGWDELLTLLMQVRRADRVQDDVYYVGVFEPAASIDAYCQAGCILGIASQTGIKDVGLRAALIIGYGSDGQNGTLAQELAHAMGRAHAPCGDPQAIDDEYPYGNATIGVPGWDILDKKILDAGGRSKDFMSYCWPVWVSDYTFGGLAQRMQDVAAAMRDDKLGPKAAGVVRSYTLDAQGNLKVGPEVDVRDLEETSGVRVHYDDASGAPLASSRAAFRPYDNMPGGILLASEPPRATRRVRVEGLPARVARPLVVDPMMLEHVTARAARAR